MKTVYLNYGDATRELKRSIAHAEMKRAGFRKINKKNQMNGKSFFANNWRDYCKTKEDK